MGLFCLAVSGWADTAEAFDRSARPLGLGLAVGSPTGVAAKYYVASHAAVQATLGIGWHGTGLHADYLYELRELIGTRGEPFDLPVFFGAGIKASVRRFSPLMGLRIPLGAAMQLHRTPLEFQIEFAPVMYVDAGGPGAGADMALSARYFF